MKIRLNAEDKLILSSIKIHPNSLELEYLNELIPLIMDWDYLINTIIDRGIGPLLYKKLPLLTNNVLIPETVKTKLQQAYFKTFSRSAILYDHFRKIVGVFVVQNIPVIGLKGVYLSEWLYQDIGLRQFSDIDLLVKEEDGEKCLKLLESIGYKQHETGKLSEFVEAQFDIVHYPPRILQGVSIEIHIKLHHKTQKYQVITSELWKNAIPTTLNGIEVQALNTNDLLIHLCLHLDAHFRKGKVQFTCFNDVVNLFEKYSKTINWNEFSETCRLYMCEDIVFQYIVMVNKYMNATVPSDIIQKYSVLLTKKDEHLFYKYLMGNSYSNDYFTSHLKALKDVPSISGKVKYLSDILFPSKSFMVQTYQIKRPWLVLLYYPYRYYIGVRGVLKHLKKLPEGSR